MSPGHGDRRRPSLEALRDNLKLLLRRPGTPTLPAGDHLDPSATTTFTIDRRSFLLVVVLFRHYPRPPLCRRDGMSQHQANRVSPPGRLQPFLLSLHFNAPHWPWEAPGDQAESERLRGRDPIHWDGGSQETYRRMIAAMDTQIGRVLRALEDGGIARDTIVIFTSDNGGERFADTWPFSGRKNELLEGGLRIPAIVSWPARIPLGRVS